MYFEINLNTSVKLDLDASITALYLRAALKSNGFYSGKSWLIAASPYSKILLFLVGFLYEFYL